MAYRSLEDIFNAAFDTVSGYLNVAIKSLGQLSKANSLSVALATDDDFTVNTSSQITGALSAGVAVNVAPPVGTRQIAIRCSTDYTIKKSGSGAVSTNAPFDANSWDTFPLKGSGGGDFDGVKQISIYPVNNGTYWIIYYGG